MLFQELIVLPTDVLGAVDFLAFFRLASVFRGENPFEGIVDACVDSAAVVSEIIDEVIDSA